MKRFDPAYERAARRLPAPARCGASSTATVDPGIGARCRPAGFVEPRTSRRARARRSRRRPRRRSPRPSARTTRATCAPYSDAFLGALVHDVNLVLGAARRAAASSSARVRRRRRRGRRLARVRRAGAVGGARWTRGVAAAARAPARFREELRLYAVGRRPRARVPRALRSAPRRDAARRRGPSGAARSAQLRAPARALPRLRDAGRAVSHAGRAGRARRRAAHRALPGGGRSVTGAVIVTGSDSGIGRADRDRARARAATTSASPGTPTRRARATTARGGPRARARGPRSRRLDLTDRPGDAIDELAAELGGLWGLVACAGANHRAAFARRRARRWRRALEVNLTGPVPLRAGGGAAARRGRRAAGASSSSRRSTSTRRCAFAGAYCRGQGRARAWPTQVMALELAPSRRSPSTRSRRGTSRRR